MVLSISAFRKWSRCQRQFYLAEIMANGVAKDELRQRAQFLGRIQQPAWWIGDIVHKSIEKWVMPKVRAGMWPVEIQVIQNAESMAKRRFAFSESGGFRDPTQKSNEDFCVLAPHFFGTKIQQDTLLQSLTTIRNALQNLLRSKKMKDFLLEREWYSWEWPLHFRVDGQSMQAKPDLIMPAQKGLGLEVVDWKVATSASDYYYQLAVYMLAALETPKYEAHARAGMRGYLVNLAESEPAIALNDPYIVTSDDTVQTINRVYETIDDIRMVTQNGDYDHLDVGQFSYANSIGTCALCNWRQLCVELGDGSPAKFLSDCESKPTQLALSLD